MGVWSEKRCVVVIGKKEVERGRKVVEERRRDGEVEVGKSFCSERSGLRSRPMSGRKR